MQYHGKNQEILVLESVEGKVVDSLRVPIPSELLH